MSKEYGDDGNPGDASIKSEHDDSREDDYDGKHKDGYL